MRSKKKENLAERAQQRLRRRRSAAAHVAERRIAHKDNDRSIELARRNTAETERGSKLESRRFRCLCCAIDKATTCFKL